MSITVSPELQAICDALEIQIVGKDDRCAPMETRAVGTMQDVLERHGAGHLTYVLRTITDSRNNKRALSSAVIAAVSDRMAANPTWCEDAERWFAAFDRINLEDLEFAAKSNAAVPRRFTVNTLLFERLWPIFDQPEQGRMPV